MSLTAVDGRRREVSASPFEETIGFCRALRAGERVLVSGTAPVWPNGEVDPSPAVQARRCLEIISGAHRPTATMVVVAGLLDPRWRVEIEAEALISGPR